MERRGGTGFGHGVGDVVSIVLMLAVAVVLAAMAGSVLLEVA